MYVLIHEKAATTSASVDEVAIAICFLLEDEMGKLVLGPMIAKCIPVVDRWVVGQPAKLASDQNVHSRSLVSSPT